MGVKYICVYNEEMMSLYESALSMRRRTILKALGLGTLAGITGGCDAMGSVFGRMFAIPARDTTYFTPNAKFYVVNYADSAVSDDSRRRH